MCVLVRYIYFGAGQQCNDQLFIDIEFAFESSFLQLGIYCPVLSLLIKTYFIQRQDMCELFLDVNKLLLTHFLATMFISESLRYIY